MAGVPPTNATRLTWQGGHRFEAGTEHGAVTIWSGEDRRSLSPMEAMLSAVAGCMAIDVVDILAKMRKTVRALSPRARARATIFSSSSDTHFRALSIACPVASS